MTMKMTRAAMLLVAMAVILISAALREAVVVAVVEAVVGGVAFDRSQAAPALHGQLPRAGVGVVVVAGVVAAARLLWPLHPVNQKSVLTSERTHAALCIFC